MRGLAVLAAEEALAREILDLMRKVEIVRRILMLMAMGEVSMAHWRQARWLSSVAHQSCPCIAP